MMKFMNLQRGMTFVEVIVVTAIATVISLAISSAISLLYEYNAYSFAQSAQVEEARRGITRMVRDIREMTYADNGGYPLLVMNEHTIGFFSDIDRDESVEYVEYVLASTTLEKFVYNATGTPPTYSTSTGPEEIFILSDYVQNINQGTTTFTYYDVSGNPAGATTTVADIRYVEAKVIVNVDPIRDPGEFMLRSSAALRNLKDNL